MAKREYVVICAQIMGDGSKPFEIVYGWDMDRFTVRQKAISHGLKIRGSDDFNIGVLENDKLISLDWMREPVDTDPKVLAMIEGYRP